MILFQANIDQVIYQQFLDNIQQYARIALHFHPDRRIASGKTVIENLLEDGYYKNQFETKISGGSTTAYVGGKRDEWEHQIFNGFYRNKPFSERPKYGALQLTYTQDGPAPRTRSSRGGDRRREPRGGGRHALRVGYGQSRS